MGAKYLYKLIQQENNGADLQVVMPMFVSTTDDTTVFAFEGAVDGKSDGFISNNNKDLDTRSAYTKIHPQLTVIRSCIRLSWIHARYKLHRRYH